MTEDRLKRFLLYTASGAAAAALAYAAARWLLVWLLPFLIALAAAAAIEPAVSFLQTRLRLRRGFASLLLTLFLLFLLGGLLSLLGSTLSREAYALLGRVPALLEDVPRALDSLLARVEQYGAACPAWLRAQVESSLRRYAAEAGTLLGSLLDRLLAWLAGLAAAVPRFFFGTAVTVLAIYFTSVSLPVLRDCAKSHFTHNARKKMRVFRCGVTHSLARWLRAELTLSSVTFVEMLLGFLFLRQPYALLLAVLITLVDALPVFGAGTVLIPWAIAELLSQNIHKSVILLIFYLIALIVRNALEPRLLGAQAGLPPIASLLAMYLGFCAFGVGGMVLFPFLLLLFAQLHRELHTIDS